MAADASGWQDIISEDLKEVSQIMREVTRYSNPEVRELILQTEAIADCKLIIQDYVDEAVDSLDILQDSPYKQSLIDLTRLNLTRVS